MVVAASLLMSNVSKARPSPPSLSTFRNETTNHDPALCPMCQSKDTHCTIADLIEFTPQEQIFVKKWPFVAQCLSNGATLLDISEENPYLVKYLIPNSPHHIPGKDSWRPSRRLTAQEQAFVSKWWWVAPRLDAGDSLMSIASEKPFLKKYLTPGHSKFIPGPEKMETPMQLPPMKGPIESFELYMSGGYPTWKSILYPTYSDRDKRWYFIDTSDQQRAAFVLDLFVELNRRMAILVQDLGESVWPSKDDPRHLKLLSMFVSNTNTTPGSISHINDKIEGCGISTTCTFAYAVDKWVHIRPELTDTRVQFYMAVAVHEVAHTVCLETDCLPDQGHGPAFWRLFQLIEHRARVLRLI
jgi:hypothetical protein